MRAAKAVTKRAGRGAGTLGNIERFGVVTTATVLAAYGVSRRSVPGLFLAVAAIPLAYAGMSGRWPARLGGIVKPRGRGDTRVALSGERGTHVRE